MLKLIKTSIERPITTSMLFLSVVLLGLVSLTKLAIQSEPNITPPMMGCFAHYERPLGTEEMERQLIKPIESEIAQLSGVKNIRVFGRGDHSAFFHIEFEFGINTKFRTIELQERLDRVISRFPKGSLRLVAFPFESSWHNRRIMNVALQGPRFDPYLQGIDIERVAQRLQDIDGIARADTWGGHTPTIEVATFQERMQEFNLPLYQLTSTVRNYAAEPVYVGEINEAGERHFVRIDSQFKTNQDLSDIMVEPEAGIFLRNVGDVNNVLLSRSRLSRVNGQPSTEFTLEKESEVNPLELSTRVRKAIQNMQETQQLPPGYSLIVTRDSSEMIRKMIEQLIRLASIGLVLAMLILHAFVRSYRMTLMICLVIPISIIATFNLMYFSDMTINMVTLVGFAIGVGSLLDNSIVVLENIARLRQRGYEAVRAAWEGTAEVTRPIVALTSTTLIVFLPVVFLKGWLQLMLREGALAVVYPLVISMAVALLFVPMAASYLFQYGTRNKFQDARNEIFGSGPTNGLTVRFLRRIPVVGSRLADLWERITFHRFRAAYLVWLRACLRHRVRLLIALVVVIFYTVFYTMGEIRRGGANQGPTNNEEIEVFVFPPEGSRLEYTEAIVSRVEDIIKVQVPELERIRSRIESDNAEVEIELKEVSRRERTLLEIKEALRKPFQEITEAEIAFEQRRQRGESTPSPVQGGRRGTIELTGPDERSLIQIIDMIEPLITQVDGIRDVYTDIERGAMELQFHMDRDKANLLQISTQSLARQIEAAQSQGALSQIRMKRDDRDLDILFQQVGDDYVGGDRVVTREEGLKLAEMKEIPIFSPQMRATVPLSELGKFELKMKSSRIMRLNQQRVATIIYSIAPNAKFNDVEAAVKGICENYPLPAGFVFHFGGMSEEWEDMSKAMSMLMWLDGLLVYMLLAALLESFFQPFVILLTIPLAIVPITWGLKITDTEFGGMALFGAVFLIGLLPNSGILLVNFASAMRREKKFSRPRAVVLACAYRLRPIVMTVSTTVLGLMPMAIQTKGSEDQWVPFAIVVISGLLGATVLTLIIIPGLYFIIEDMGNLLQKGVKYLFSLRWMFVFWSARRRAAFREQVTAYRSAPPRPEPLILQTWNLTRVYQKPFLLRLSEGIRGHELKRRFGQLIEAPALGIVAKLPAYDPVRERRDLTSTTTRHKALAGVDLTVERGLFGLLGPNGAGKTTLIRLLVGIDQPTRGTCHVCGFDVVRENSQARRLIGYLPQDFGLYSEKTARQYLDYFGLLKGLKDRRERAFAVDRALEWVNLSDVRDLPVSGFSGGMIRRLGLAQIFLSPPRVLIVDEPTAGLDPLERLRFRNVLTQLAMERIVILSTHIVEDIAHSCKRLAVLQKGRITFDGDQAELIERAEGHVIEMQSDDRNWSKYREYGEVTGMQRTAHGVTMRLVMQGPPPPHASVVVPSLEDAYVFHRLETELGP